MCKRCQEPLFVFRPRIAFLAGDHSQDIKGDIERITDTDLHVIDESGKRYTFYRDTYEVLWNSYLRYGLVNVHGNWSRWLLVDTWKDTGKDGYELASYRADEISIATEHAKRLNVTTVHPTLEETLDRVDQIMEEARQWKEKYKRL